MNSATAPPSPGRPAGSGGSGAPGGAAAAAATGAPLGAAPAGPDPGPSPPPLFEHFVVCGLSGAGLAAVSGEGGFLGSDVKYKPAFLDRLPHGDDARRRPPPPQLPTVSPCTKKGSQENQCIAKAERWPEPAAGLQAFAHASSACSKALLSCATCRHPPLEPPSAACQLASTSS